MSVDKQKKTAAELEEIVKQRIGAGDFKVTVHANLETGWHATIYGRQPAEVHRIGRGAPLHDGDSVIGFPHRRKINSILIRNTVGPIAARTTLGTCSAIKSLKSPKTPELL